MSAHDAKEAAVAVMNTIELTGVSAESWGDAAREALKEASRTIRGINKLHVLGTSAVVEDGVIAEYHTEVRIFFEIET
ncbi:MAG TPA: dodecin family protein [Actinomycetota bacterium]|nr:dodecin family protein [Actinomycetota bacterium]